MEQTNQEKQLNEDQKNSEPFFEKKRKMSTWKGDLLSELSMDYQFQNDFPRLQKYDNLELIKQQFAPLKNINNPDINLKNYEESNFLFIYFKSFDDYHKSMKYGIFSLFSKENNDILNDIYQQDQKQKRKTLLVCYMENEDHYIGLAELQGNYNPNFEYAYWWDDSYLKGIFNVEWIFIKNFYFYKLKRFIDNPRIPIPGLLKSFNKSDSLYILDHYKQIPYNYNQSIFQFFQLFDQREDYLHKTRIKTDFNISLKKKEYKPYTPRQKKRKYSNYQKKQQVYEDDQYIYVKKN